MIAKKCDRCAKLYEAKSKGNTPKSDGTGANGFAWLDIDAGQRYFLKGIFDLCPACTKELVDWFNAPKAFKGER